MRNGKTHIIFMSDHPLVLSGVGKQSRILIEKLLNTGRYSFFCVAGALKHARYGLQAVSPPEGETRWTAEDFRILPVDGYGDKALVRKLLREEKPDAVFFFTDPRFWVWLWEMEDEVRAQCPMLFNHIWDAGPTPLFNKVFYDSTDYLGCISLVTYGIMQAMGVDPTKFDYVPHAVPIDVFKPLPEEETQAFRQQFFGPHKDREFIVFWNNRNARRKQTGDVLESFSLLAKRVGKQKVALAMRTDPLDREGQNVTEVAKRLGIDDNLLLIDRPIEEKELNLFYNACDVTLNISSAEGFGLGTLESLSAGTPIVVNMTGGLQFQVGDWWKDLTDFSDQKKLEAVAQKAQSLPGVNWWGKPVFPAVRLLSGGQDVPYIYAEHVDNEDVARALQKVMEMGRGKRQALGLRAREWAAQTFPMEALVSKWDGVFQRFAGQKQRTYRTATV